MAEVESGLGLSVIPACTGSILLRGPPSEDGLIIGALWVAEPNFPPGKQRAKAAGYLDCGEQAARCICRSAPVLSQKWDHEFESSFLQRRVGCELGRGSNVRERGVSWALSD